MDTGGNRWRRERDELMHPRYARAGPCGFVNGKRLRAEVGGEIPFFVVSSMFKLLLRRRDFFEIMNLLTI